MTMVKRDFWYGWWLLWWMGGNLLDLITTLPLMIRFGAWGEANPLVTLVFNQLGAPGVIVMKILYTGVFALIFALPVPGRKILFALSLAMVWFSALGNLVVLFLLW